MPITIAVEFRYLDPVYLESRDRYLAAKPISIYHLKLQEKSRTLTVEKLYTCILNF